MDKVPEIVILSGKGGTGKTSIAAAFMALAEDAVCSDCDVDAADLHLVLSPAIQEQEPFASGAKAVIDPDKCTACDLCRDLCRFHAIEETGGTYLVDEYACEGCGLCAAACPADAIRIESYLNNDIYFGESRFGPLIYGKLGIAEENSGRLVSKIRQLIKTRAEEEHARFIITDGPPGIGCPAISSVTGADLVIAVTEPTLSGWHDLQRLLDMIHRFRTPVWVIINKSDLNTEMTEKIIQELALRNIKVLGQLPYEESMIHALIAGKTIIEYEPGSLLHSEIQGYWNRIVNYFSQK